VDDPPQQKMSCGCIIWGGYAKGNTGDEICLAAALERKQMEFDDNVAVLSHLPEHTSQLFPQAIVIPYVPPSPKTSRLRKRFVRACKSLTTASGLAYLARNARFDTRLEWTRVLSSAGQLYLAGGGYLTDLFPMDFVMPPIQLALKLNVPVTSAPIGIGPFKSRLRADEATAALRQIKLTVRDQTSMDFCRARGINASLAPDDAFAFVKDFLPPISMKRPGNRARKIGVCIFTQYGQDANCDLKGWWTECLRELKAQHPEYEIEGFCFHTSLQAEFQAMRQLFSLAGLPLEHVLEPTADFRRTVETIRSYDLVISTRFHATVTANVFDIPNIAIAAGDYYQAKMSAARLGFESTCSLIFPASQRPSDLLNICKFKLAGRQSMRP
jgi:polysaccharide pyruvyl transferase WcaK-like protein